MQRFLKNAFVKSTVALMVSGSFLLPFAARAATISGFSDTLTRHQASETSDHTVLFVTPTGVQASTDTVTLSFDPSTSPTFVMGAVSFDDIDLAVDTTGDTTDCSGPFTDKTLAATPAAGVWGAVISSNVLTFTPPTDSAIGEVPAGDCLQIQIGTNATAGGAGTDQITNPNSAVTLSLLIGGVFGDTGTAYLPFNDSDQVSVTATVADAGGGGGGGVPPPATAPVISNIQIISITETDATITWITDVGSDSTVEYGLTDSYGTSEFVAGSVFSHIVPLTSLTAGVEYHFRVKSLGAGGETVSADNTFTTLDSTAPVISNIQNSNVTATTATITWDTDEDATSRVDYDFAEPYAFSEESLTFTNSHQIELTGLTSNSIYRYRVTSEDSSANSSQSVEFTFATGDNVPPALSDITATGITETEATITWATGELADSKVVYGTTEAYDSEETEATLIANHSVPLSILLSGTLYHYVVVSTDAFGNTATSTDQTFTTLSDTTPPANATSFNATSSDSSADFTWTNPIDGDFAGITIVRSTTATPTDPTDGTVVYDGIDETYTDTGLDNGVTYYYTAFTYDASGNYSSGAITSVVPADGLPPGPVTSFTVTPSDSENLLQWTNAIDADLAGVRIQRSTTSFPATPIDGTNIFLGSGISFLDTGLTNDTTYFYSIFSVDTSGNVSVPAQVSGTPTVVIVCGNAICEPPEDNASCALDCPLTPVCGDSICQPPENPVSCEIDCPVPVVCGDDICSVSEDNDSCAADCPLIVVCGDGTCQPPENVISCEADCAVPAVCGDSICQVSESSESCAIDCPVPPSCGDSICQSPETPESCAADCVADEPDAPVCGDGPCDAGETNLTCPSDCPLAPDEPVELIEEPEETIEPEEAMNLTLIQYFTHGRTLRVYPDGEGLIRTLNDVIFSMMIPVDAFKKPLNTLILNLGNSSYIFKKTLDETMYVVDIVISNEAVAKATLNPEVKTFEETAREFLGVKDAEAAEQLFKLLTLLIVNYQDGTVEVTSPALSVEEDGFIFTQEEGSRKILSDVIVTLQEKDGAGWKTWDASKYKQTNPMTTGADGKFGFMAPPGDYRVIAENDEYRTRFAPPFFLVTETANINPDIEMVALPKPITEVIIPGAPITENILNVTKSITEQSVFITSVIRTELIEDPRTEKAARSYIVPTAAVVTTAVVATSVQAVSFLSYLYFLLTQPILLIFRRKRKEYGTIFNSLSKMPIDLAIVRLFRKDGKLVRTLVTDKQGRYAFLADTGEYRMEASKPKFLFPTVFMKGMKEGVKYLDLYHGETIRVSESGAIITANIPLDPIESVKTGRRLIIERFLRKLQDLGGLISVLVTGMAYLLYRFPYLLVIFLVQLGLYFVFRRISRPRRPKNWGIVYDEENQKPIPFAVARIIETEYNKVLESQITDRQGRYNFLVGNNKYFVSIEKPGYEEAKTGHIDLSKAKDGEAIVAEDIGLRKTSSEKMKEAAEKGMSDTQKKTYEEKLKPKPQPKLPTATTGPMNAHQKVGTDDSDENEMKRMYMEKMAKKAEESKKEEQTDE